ncbi:hypothetical protein [Bordetella bronchiseptica]|uniref:Uncharacterized protein n=1 Tax=Bordetella bronchiseptica (strain ATCC BAA-588 / NCTC 13252 / RB50) TaxID=257310 RepID=A0A0H3LPR0_BORBR|nr:hypothetical protein [Bordetella bronchiseptica]BAO70087.1 hypothetical protein BBS798_3362 [Bordetella bronchiseptica]CAE34024.1 phage-related hypothetical protein [Bordetella bronchiseptica RB50]
MTTCRQCKSTFQPSERQIRKSDFLCSECQRAYDAAYRAARKASGNPVKTGQMPRSYHQAYEAAYAQRPGVRERRASLMRGYARLHAGRHAARRKLRHEVEMGRIVPLPCEVCGDTPTDGHHASYALPLAVTWLCKQHHQELHAKAKGEQS